ncbi:hypothetical protein OG21DRAFT_1479172 [Imleria badia]|nr:hypothetical protein OG21DRAFT_1479172 [Imleria badia]
MPTIHVDGDRRTHKFKCSAKGCKATIQRCLNTKNARSTGNLRKHVKKCWEEDVRTHVMGGILRNGSITAAFEQKGKGKVTYSNQQHTWAETRDEIVCWVAENLRPFQIVKDHGFLKLMKMGRPEYYVPSPATVAQDVHQVFALTCQCIAKMLRVSMHNLLFTTGH